MPYTRKWGSKTAKGGFDIEEIISKTFEKWENSPDAQDWLKVMNYDLEKIEDISARTPRGTGKADIILEISLPNNSARERITVKKTKDSRFNQVSKRSVDDYAEIFNFSDMTRKALKKFCGEEGYRPKDLVKEGVLDRSDLDSLYDTSYHDPPIRLSFEELSEEEQKSVERDFSKKQKVITKTVLAGDPLEVDWYMAVRAKRDNESYEVEETMIEPIEETIDRYAQGGFRPSSRSSFYIGQIFVQRKSGTPDPEKLQFKINPWL